MKLLNFAGAIILISVSLVACNGIERSAGQVLDNANSVIRSESPKVWVPKEEQESGSDTAEKERKRHEAY